MAIKITNFLTSCMGTFLDVAGEGDELNRTNKRKVSGVFQLGSLAKTETAKPKPARNGT